MSLKRLIESFDCVAGDCKETRFADDIPAMQELEAALHAAADALKRVRRTRMCDYRDAFQQTIEDRYPDAAWYEVAPIDMDVALYGGVDNAITEILEAVKPEFRDGKMPEKAEDKEPCREDLGGDVADYQRWVDYDMKRYGRISDKTQRDIDKAGLSVVKDQYGEYEVIAKEADHDARHEDLDKLKRVAPDLEMETEKPVEGKEKLKKVAPDLETEGCKKRSRKPLQEGPGAGYEISGEIGRVTINSLTVDDSKAPKIRVHVDGKAEVHDVRAESYYYAGEIDDTTVDLSEIVFDMSDAGPSPYDDIDANFIREELEGVKFETMVGAGWSHVTFSGKLHLDINKDISVAPGMLLDSFDINFDQDATSYIDAAVQGDLEESCNNSLKEELSEDEEKAKALSDELDKEVDFHNGIFETNNGEEYEVLTDDEADERFSDGVRELIDEMGIEAFSPNFQEWIKDNALDSEWFDEAKDESNEYYMQDIRDESDYEYSSRLLREMVEEGVVDESDLEENEDGLLDLKEGSVDDYWEDFKELLNDRWSDSIQWYIDNFGDEDLTTVIKNNSGILDIDKIIEEVKDFDGRGNEIASYDGEEIELDNGYFAYRVS